jgi:rod shape-determining protein MreC
MNAGRILSEYRPIFVLVVLSALSLFSIFTGTEGTVVHNGISRVVNITSYPFLKLRHATVNVPSRIYHFVADHNTAYKENKELNRDLVNLKGYETLAVQMRQENARLRQMLQFISEQPRFTLKPVVVLESYKGMLRIDAGSRAGIKSSMGVIARDGVVGVVTEVADFTATVATIHHTDCRVGAMVLRNRLRAYDGVVQATGSDFSHLCSMEYIDKTNTIGIGDVVVTSPESQFPAGIVVGKINAVRSGEGLWKSAEIVPAVDPYRLDEVMVVVRAVDESGYLAGPPEALQREVSSEQSLLNKDSAATELPDMRPVQERYAP